MLLYKDGRYYFDCDTSYYPTLARLGWRFHDKTRMWHTSNRNIVSKSSRMFNEADRLVFKNSEAKAKMRMFESLCITPSENHGIVLPNNGLDPFNYQLAGVEFMLGKRSVYNADDMGLGKSMQSILYCNTTSPKRVIIVCPALVKWNWIDEWEKWTTLGSSIEVAEGNKYPGSDIVIINYDIISRHRDKMNKADLIIMDEAHYAKNSKAQRTKALFGEWQVTKPLEAQVKHALSGTPIPNRPIEMFAMLKYLSPVDFNNKEKFARRFCDFKKDEYGRWNDKGSSNLDELQDLLRSTVMLRRMKSQVLKDLPPKIRQVVLLDPDEKSRSYLKRQNNLLKHIPLRRSEVTAENVLDEKEFVDTIRSMSGQDRSNLIAMRKDAAICKLPMALEHIEEAQKSFKKIIVFAYHTEVIKALQARFPSNHVMVDGSVDPEERIKLGKVFNGNDGINFFFGQYQASGIGINLTSAELVIFLESPLTPGDVTQCEDRAHRIGLMHNLLVQHLMLKDSIDAAIAKLIIEKQEIIDKGLNYEEGSILEEVLK